MQLLFRLSLNLLFVYLTNGVVLKTPMTNKYPQIAVLGCDSRKANLYYDIDKQVWVEHLVSSCVNNEQSILEFCQQAYPSFHIGNIVRLDTVLRFENWCELISPIDKNGDNIHRCKKSSGTDEVVQPFRCLYMNSKREEIHLPSADCTIHSIIGTGECLRAEKWQQLSSMECANKSMSLNNSIMTLDWCGLSEFRGIEFVCCPLKKTNDNDYETTIDEQENQDLLDESSHRRILSMTLASREPSWIEDYRRWNTDPAYFADDEDTNDYQPSPVPKSLENLRFSKEKEKFKQKYKEQIDQLKFRWQKRLNEIHLLSKQNLTAAKEQFQRNDVEFEKEYEILKQSANRERTRINELHEIHFDATLNNAKAQANKKLISAWNQRPLKTENVGETLYNYLQLLLRDRIHLVNRFERLRAVDPEQAERQRNSIHERLRLIVDRISDALNQLRLYPNLQSKIQPRLDVLFSEYDEVNQAAEKLLKDYAATSTTTTTTTTISSDNNEYDYATEDEYDEIDDQEDKTTTVENFIQTENNDDFQATFDIEINDQNQQAFINENSIRLETLRKNVTRSFLITYLPYFVGCLFLICFLIGIFFIRILKQKRLFKNQYEKSDVLTEVDCFSPLEKSFENFQINGYENPTYKFFESQTAKC